MKKKDVIDLIISHYENDPRLFFHKTIEILKELKADGDDALVDSVGAILKRRVKLAPKREESPYTPKISLEDADALTWTFVPQEK